ncbi:hypothetical protein chiPu_0029275, partial [Chiloscyllium punctatum]|nr:hypothetical protein [Chiloscyllium punctatum]
MVTGIDRRDLRCWRQRQGRCRVQLQPSYAAFIGHTKALDPVPRELQR